MLKATRLVDHPIISPDTPGWDVDTVGSNINGPSLIRVPDWVANPLGRYYLYFAHHQGDRIRLAYADTLAGPWTIYTPGTLQLTATPFTHHIASPDLHVLDDKQQLVMIYHGCGHDPIPNVEQPAAVATSADGLNWEHEKILPAESYLRAFVLNGRHLGIAKGGRMYEAAVGTFDFGPKMIGRMDISGRHFAVHVDADQTLFFYSRFGDAPEHMLHLAVPHDRDVLDHWHLLPRQSLLLPERDWEGSELPVVASRVGAVHEPVHALRDPCVFQETAGEGGVYLCYSTAGEAGLGIARLTSLCQSDR